MKAKRTFHRAWSALLALALVLGISPAMSLTAKAEYFSIWVNDVEVSDENADLVPFPGKGFISYNQEENTLYLIGVDMTTQGDVRASIYISRPNVTISLFGNNSITSGTSSIFCENGDVTITGDGKLTLRSGDHCIEAQNIVINGVTLDLQSDTDTAITGKSVTLVPGQNALMRVDVGDAAPGSAITGSPFIAKTRLSANDISHKYVHIYGEARNLAVTVTPGENMTKTSGEETQIVQMGNNMTPVVYEADEGYYFPGDYSVESKDGVSVTRNSFTQITVSGTPTADVAIKLTAPREKEKEPTPNATFTATGYDTGTLSNMAVNMQYSLDGGVVWALTAITFETGASVDLTGVSPGKILVVKLGNGTNTVHSDFQTIEITRATTPSLAVTQPTTIGGTGSVATTTAHEYSADGEAWSDCTGETTGLAPGRHYVRVKASGTALASDAQEVTISAFDPPPVTLTGISLDHSKAKKTYAEGEALDVSGLVLTAQYSDGNTKTVDVTEDMVSGFDSSKTGKQTLTVTYEGFEAKYEVEVKAQPLPVTLTGISLDSNSAKTEYFIGEALDVSGLVLTASYSDNSTKKIDVTKAMVTGFDGSKTGKQTLTVTYESFTDTYEVEVKAETNPPVPTIIYTAKGGSGNTIQSVTWQKGSGKNLDLTFKRSEDDHLTYGLFGSLEIGGQAVGSANYDAAEGSLKLSVKPEYLETLSVGDHTVKVNFQDGSSAVKLTVLAASAEPTPSPTPKPSEKPASPKTGDESNLALHGSLMFLAVAAMIALFLYARKRKTEK